MAIMQLAENLYIAPQLGEADAAEAARLGIRSVICNRPNGEETHQPDYEQVKSWLAAAGITETAWQPVTAPTITLRDGQAFRLLAAASDQPVLAYCRSGTRSALLWAYGAVANGTSVADALAAAARAGVDLSKFAAGLEQAAGR
ncbi:Uncharacterized protein conserved in bacteria [Kingella potus]|uniref:Uncharacterized protein conserved in bacteria n=1 Tax=Kingella potus TaxID=265175 RepID=A0A377R171_9NEIS|nr:TIGR01244 family sulfur transferase [Kingella potus]UOP01136.1 TIGR01244 family sulfur transferase [Kingella potus]STR00839.1 Uncharacterized protein conserved in bacteria [Kingella potus]